MEHRWYIHGYLRYITGIFTYGVHVDAFSVGQIEDIQVIGLQVQNLEKVHSRECDHNLNRNIADVSNRLVDSQQWQIPQGYGYAYFKWRVRNPTSFFSYLVELIIKIKTWVLSQFLLV